MKKKLIDLINEEIKLWMPDKNTPKKEINARRKEAKDIKKRLMQMYDVVGEKETYKIFGYGSLLNERSRSRTMDPISVSYGKLKGFRRIFNLGITQGTCLNIEPAPDSMIDGAICEINAKDMLAFMLREFQYQILKGTTEEDEEVFFVLATKEDTPNIIDHPDPFSDPYFDWQQAMPRLDYLQACYHGIEQLIEDCGIKEHLLLSDDTITFDRQPIQDLIEELSPSYVVKDKETGLGRKENNLLNYWKIIDSAY